MNNEIINNLLDKKISKQEFIDYLTARIKTLDDNSEDIIIGIDEKKLYKGYIGKNVKIKTSINLVEELSKNLPISYFEFDGDDRIIELIYNSIIDNDVASLISLTQNIAPMTMMDSLGINEQLRNNIFFTNAVNGKTTKYSELRNKFLCMCVEKATLFHNICKILGFDSQIIFGTIEKNGVLVAHTYNIINIDNNKFIVDLTRSVEKLNNGETQILIPIAIISSEDYNKLIKGDKINIDMTTISNSLYNANCIQTNNVYGAGMTLEDKKKILLINLKSNEKAKTIFSDENTENKHL